MDKVEFNEDEALIFLYGLEEMPELMSEPSVYILIRHCQEVLKDIDFSETALKKVEDVIYL